MRISTRRLVANSFGYASGATVLTGVQVIEAGGAARLAVRFSAVEPKPSALGARTCACRSPAASSVCLATPGLKVPSFELVGLSLTQRHIYDAEQKERERQLYSDRDENQREDENAHYRGFLERAEIDERPLPQ